MGIFQQPHIEPRIGQKKEISTKQVEVARSQLKSSFFQSYKFPPLELLQTEARQQKKVDEESLKANAKMLEKKLLDFEVEGRGRTNTTYVLYKIDTEGEWT